MLNKAKLVVGKRPKSKNNDMERKKRQPAIYAFTDSQINQSVYKLYGLTPKEIEIVENRI